MSLDTNGMWTIDLDRWGALHKARGGRPHSGIVTCLADTDAEIARGILRGYFQRKDPDVFVGFTGSHL